MIYLKNYVFFLILLYFSSPAALLCQEIGEIRGSVIDAKTGEPLIGVNILIQNTFIGTSTDNNGQFVLSNLKPGRYGLMISMMGYRKETIGDIDIQPGKILKQEIRLEQDVLIIPQVVVTASRKEQDIMESPLSIAVVGLRQIEEKGAITLEEVLPYESGVTSIKGQLNIRGTTGYTLGAGSRSLVLVDGVPLLGSAAGNVTWTIIPASEIAQVEIVKSGGSALYGSGAMGGVMNIITRNAPSTPETRVRVKMGSYSHPRYEQWNWRNETGKFYTAEATHAHPFGNHTAWFRVQRNSTDGYTELNWKEWVNLTGKIKLNYGTRYNASLYANYIKDKGGLESLWKSAADPFEAPFISENDRGEGDKLNLNGFFNYIYSPATVLKVKGSLYRVYWQNHGSNSSFSNERKYFGETQFSTNWTHALNSTAGLVFENASINARIFGNHDSYSAAAYLSIQQRLSRKTTITAGGRWENYMVDSDRVARTVAPKLAVNWNHNQWLALRASAGKGFRVPTIAELFSEDQLNVFRIEPNPDLNTETSFSYEAGGTVMLQSGSLLSHLKLDGAIFLNVFNDLIEPIPDNHGIIHFENITNARISGQELSLRVSLLNNRMILNSAYTRLNPVEINKQGDAIDTLSYRFRHNLVTTTTGYWRSLALTLEYRYASQMEKTELFPENIKTGQDRRVPIHLWNASIGYSWKEWNFLFRVENIFQYYYVELERNMGEERNVSLSITTQF